VGSCGAPGGGPGGGPKFDIWWVISSSVLAC
jgi:hypothetical protein